MDSLDKCPDVAGIFLFSGCPDQDRDGIQDAEDVCPAVFGLARLNGCPIPDQDNDGINDEQDKCPLLPGKIANAGCPVISDSLTQYLNFLAKNIFFETNRHTLKKSSFESLDQIADMLNRMAGISLQIEGHTDNTGRW